VSGEPSQNVAEIPRIVVLDASALLAYLQAETGAGRIEDLLLSQPCQISTVNLAEVLTRLADWQIPLSAAEERIAALGLVNVPFDQAQARRAAEMRHGTRTKGLSLGDRACLALAQQQSALAMTADRAWRDLGLNIAIECIR